jgi:hypothetical protein
MIISVSGKIGSGKDTIAKLIQEMYPEQNWINKKWAGKLKEVASLISGIPIEKFEDQEFKQTYMSSEWDKYLPNVDRPERMTVRDFLQILGTEAMREGLHRNTWVNALLADYKPIQIIDNEGIGRSVYPNWIITDTRFPNELHAVRQTGLVCTIKVVRDQQTDIGATHSSETALDYVSDWDMVIENNGTIEDLKSQLSQIIFW